MRSLSPENKAAQAEFEALLNAQDPQYRTGFHPGERVTAHVLSIGKRHVVLDVNAKNEGLASLDEFETQDGKPEIAVGDRVDVVFVGMKEGALYFSTHVTGAVAVDQSIAQAFSSGLPVEGRVQGEINGGYEVTIGGRRAFCPFSQISLFKQEGAEYIGRTMTFIVQEYDEDGHNLVVSHRAVLEQERDKQREHLRLELVEGQTRTGKVTRLVDFGFFVDLGGVEGLVPLKEISWSRDVTPADVVQEGATVEVLVRSIDWERNRISLSLRATQVDPFDAFTARYPVGSRLRGKVTHLEPFGAFIELLPGVEGLAHIRLLGGTRRIAHPREAVAVGDEIDVQVESIDSERRRIGLRPIPAAGTADRAGADEAAAETAAIEELRRRPPAKELGSLGDLLSGLKL